MKHQAVLSFTAGEVRDALQAQYPEACLGKFHKVFVVFGHREPEEVHQATVAVQIRYTPSHEESKK